MIIISGCAQATLAPETVIETVVVEKIVSAPTAAPAAAELAAEAALALAPLEIPVLSGAPIPAARAPLNAGNARNLRPFAVWGSAPFGPLAYSPDGRWIAAASRPGISLFEADTLYPAGWLRLGGPGAEVAALDFAPGGDKLAVGLFDGELQLWSLSETGRRLEGSLDYSLPAHSGLLYDMALAPNGEQIYTAGTDAAGRPEVSAWRTGDFSRSALPVFSAASLTGLALSPDGSTLATGAVDGTLALIDLERGTGAVAFQAESGPFSDLEFAGRGSSTAPLLAAAGGDNTIHLWRLRPSEPPENALQELAAWPNAVTPLDLAFSSDGSWLAAGFQDGAVQLRPTEGAARPLTWQVDQPPLNSLLFTENDGRTPPPLLVGSNTLQLWDGQAGELLAGIAEVHRLPASLAYSPDGSLLAAGTQAGAIELWSAADGRLLRQFGAGEAPLTDLAVSAEGNLLASGAQDGGVQLWSLPDGRLLADLPGQAAGISGLAFVDNGDSPPMLASAAADGKIMAWLLLQGAPAAILEDLSGAQPGALASGILNGVPALAVARAGGSVQILQPGEWSQLAEVSSGLPLAALAFLPGGQLLTLAESGEIMTWDLSDGDMQAGVQSGASEISGLAISPDGDLAAISAANGLFLVDLGRMQAFRLPGRSGYAAAAFTPDGQYLGTAGEDGTITIWGTGEP